MSFKLGEAFRFDWSEDCVIIGDEHKSCRCVRRGTCFRSTVPSLLVYNKYLKRLRPLAGVMLRTNRVERTLEFPGIIRLILRRHQNDPYRLPLVIGYGFEYGKRRLLRRLWPGTRFIFLPMNQPVLPLERLIAEAGPFEPWAWSFRDLDDGLGSTLWGDRPVTRVEDGFLRSVGLGAGGGALPYSLCLDRSGLYFDASAPSDLEDLINGYNFDADPELLERGEFLLRRLLATGLSKYNFSSYAAENHNAAGPTCVLVVGQVEDDQSIRRNRSEISTNEALLARAIADNPGRRVVFRPHPDIATGRRPAISRPDRLLPQFEHEAPGQPLAMSLERSDLVYTISSLAGFEALMRDKRVRTFGAPFYAGWGLTDDALTFPRRIRRLSLVELLSVAYLIYPIYFDPETAERLTAFDVIDRIAFNLQSPPNWG